MGDNGNTSGSVNRVREPKFKFKAEITAYYEEAGQIDVVYTTTDERAGPNPDIVPMNLFIPYDEAGAPDLEGVEMIIRWNAPIRQWRSQGLAAGAASHDANNLMHEMVGTTIDGAVQMNEPSEAAATKREIENTPPYRTTLNLISNLLNTRWSEEDVRRILARYRESWTIEDLSHVWSE